jgi:hypothetical protein
MSSRFLSAAYLVFGALLIATACGSEENTDNGSSGGSSGFGGSSGNIGGSSGNIDPGELAGCASDTLKGESLPLDIQIMLDVSGSMNEPTGNGNNAPTKFVAVKTALKGFIGDTNSAGIGVGLQVFPIEHAGSPAECSGDGDCAGGFGTCIKKACDTIANGGLLPCDSAADCPGGAACGDLLQCGLGVCIKNGTVAQFACPNACKNNAVVAKSICSKTECFVDDYNKARVAIAPLPGNASALTSNIDALPTPPNNALTPTSAALTGGLDYAKAYAAANAGHAVVLVLATDGLPTRCPPYEAAGVAAIAAGGLPTVKTFVIGVFAPDFAAAGKSNLDAIAKAGGTNQALIVSTSGNVVADFQAAMDKIRGAALPCDYKIPSPTSGTVDYGRMNVKFTKGDGSESVFPQSKNGASGCDASGGWYYDVDPATGGTPTKITLCPASCDAVKNGGGGAKIDVVVGCVTIIK